jgi:hypothetical protein
VPDPSPLLSSLLPHSVGPYLALVLGGFAVGILGHLASSRRLVIVGVAMIAAGAFLLPLALNVTESDPPGLGR